MITTIMIIEMIDTIIWNFTYNYFKSILMAGGVSRGRVCFERGYPV